MVISKYKVSATDCYMFLAVAIYAFFSDPTPDNIGLAEIVIGGLLILITGVSGVLHVTSGAFIFGRSSTGVLGVSNTVFLYFLLAPTVVSLLHGWSMIDIIRDLIPWVYMFIFLFLFQTLSRSEIDWALKGMPFVLSINGVAYSIRHFLDSDTWITDIGTGFFKGSTFYFSTDPSVLFAAIFLSLTGISYLSKSFRARNFTFGVICLLLSTICVGALSIKGHRGPLALFVFTQGVYLLFNVKNIKSILAISLFVGVIFYFGQDLILNLIERLLKKNDAQGINGRGDEWLDVWYLVSSNSFSMLFGMGWGSLFFSEAAGGAYVNFAHWIISYLFLKGGIIGVIFFIWLLWHYLKSFFLLARENLIVSLSCLGPLVVGLLIYGNYRYLSFGLILTILVLNGARNKLVPQP